MPKVELKAGDTVRNLVTKDEGRIARVVDHSELEPKAKGVVYVVALPPRVMTVGNSISLIIQPAREVLWRECEVAHIE